MAYSLSIPFVGFLRMQPIKTWASYWGLEIDSQFPLWDFFECNAWGHANVKTTTYIALNSLCGISSNATQPEQRPSRVQGGYLSIPFVGFLRMQQYVYSSNSIEVGYDSQFPLWDFFECNKELGAYGG